jgi:hypothetical protein
MRVNYAVKKPYKIESEPALVIFLTKFFHFSQRNFICRSAEYNYVTLQCRLSDYDRRTAEASLQPVELVEATGVDYFENLCLSSESLGQFLKSNIGQLFRPNC